MKKNVFSFALFIVVSSACEQKFETWQVAKKVLHAFKQLYPFNEADWEIEDSIYGAIFKTGCDNITLLYNKNGDLLQSEKNINASELPGEIKNYLSQL